MAQLRPIPGGDGSASEGGGYLQAAAGYGDADFVLPAPFGASGSPDGLGAYARPVPGYAQPSQVGSGSLSGSPILRSLQKLSRRSSKRGYGDTAPGGAVAPVVVTAGLVAFVMMDLALSGVAGYYVGKAVAPSSSSENKYAWWGVAAGLLGGPIGLGIEALVALNHKGSR